MTYLDEAYRRFKLPIRVRILESGNGVYGWNIVTPGVDSYTDNQQCAHTIYEESVKVLTRLTSQP